MAVAITIFSFVLLIREREVFCLSSSRESFGRVKFQTSNWIWKRILLLSHFSDYCSVRFVVIERTQFSNWNMLKNAFPGIFHAQPTQPNDKKNGTTKLIRSLNRLTQSVLPATALKWTQNIFQENNSSPFSSLFLLSSSYNYWIYLRDEKQLVKSVKQVKSDVLSGLRTNCIFLHTFRKTRASKIWNARNYP